MATTVTIKLNKEQIKDRIDGDRFALFLAQNWKRLIDPYTPRANGTMMEHATVSPGSIHYPDLYSHYMYMGEVYVDPLYNVSGWFSEKYGWYSRRGVKKVPSGRRFNYGKVNPFATDHWDEKAAKAGQLDKLIRISERALNARRF